MEVSDIPGLLHGLTQVLTGEIMTTPLRVQVSDIFSPYMGISLSTNFPVTAESLSQAIELSTGSIDITQIPGQQFESLINPVNLITAITSPNETGDSKKTLNTTKVVVTPLKNEDGSSSETHFTITPKDRPFTYSTDYSLVVHTTLHPKYGTESLGQEVQKSIHTSAYATVGAYQNIKDSSGTLSDTRSYDMSTRLLPSEQLFFLVSFDQVVPLDPTFLTVRTEKDHTPIESSIAYAKMNMYDAQGNITGIEDNKQQLKITPKNPLKQDTAYKVVISKNSNKAITKDETYGFRTASALVVSGLSLLSNTLGCVYMNNKILGRDEYYDYSYTPDTKL